VIFINIIINFIVTISNSLGLVPTDMFSLAHTVELYTVWIFGFELLLRYATIGYDRQYKGLKGKVRFTFTFMTLIDIIVLLSYLITTIPADSLVLRLIRFLRFFKLVRAKHIVKNFLNISTFAAAPIYIQAFVLFITSLFFITLFSFVYTSYKTSLMIFLDPPALVEASNNIEMIFGIIELIIGLFIGGTLISIISELLNNISDNIKKGYQPYKEKNHIVIINSNHKLEFILQELNINSIDTQKEQDIVLFLPFEDNIEEFYQKLINYSNLNITIISGDATNWKFYDRVNINYAKKILILQNIDDNANVNIKLSKFILTNSKFTNKYIEFVIESNKDDITEVIYDEIFHKTNIKYIIIDHNKVIEQLLNRSIIEIDYFKLYDELLSFNGYRISNISLKTHLVQPKSYKDISMMFESGCIIGVKQKDKITINPQANMIISTEDNLIVIIKNEFLFTLNQTYKTNISTHKINTPNIKESKIICIIGNYDDIKKENITQFLTDDSIKRIVSINKDDGNYMNREFWDSIIYKSYDKIILNLEDEYEFILTMYLRGVFRDNKKFLSNIINIIHDSNSAKLIEDKKFKNNIILSEKIIAQYMTQLIFNKDLEVIYDEITQAKGSEFYLLERQKYPKLFKMQYKEIKSTLLDNNMVYIGIIKDEKVYINCTDIINSSKIVVLAQGSE